MASATQDLRLPSQPMAGTDLYYLVNRGTLCVNKLPRVLREAERPGLEPATSRLQAQCPNHYANATTHMEAREMWIIIIIIIIIEFNSGTIKIELDNTM